MHFTVYVIPPTDTPDECVSEVVEQMLEPYDENRAVEPYRRRVDDDDLQRLAGHIGVSLPEAVADIYAPATHTAHVGSISQAFAGRTRTTTAAGTHPALAALLAALPDWVGADECGVDEDGLYWMCCWNPDGQWDYWTPIAAAGEDLGVLAGVGDDNVVLCGPESSVPYAVITPDGTWHAPERPPIEEYLSGRETRDDYLERVARAEHEWGERGQEILRAHAGARMAIVDCHS